MEADTDVVKTGDKVWVLGEVVSLDIERNEIVIAVPSDKGVNSINVTLDAASGPYDPHSDS